MIMLYIIIPIGVLVLLLGAFIIGKEYRYKVGSIFDKILTALFVVVLISLSIIYFTVLNELKNNTIECYKLGGCITNGRITIDIIRDYELNIAIDKIQNKVY